jgi:hypothetical protein
MPSEQLIPPPGLLDQAPGKDAGADEDAAPAGDDAGD